MARNKESKMGSMEDTVLNSTEMTHMRYRWEAFTSDLKEIFRTNGTLLTLLAFAVIVISGISIIDSRDNWWVSIVGITAVFVVLILFMNARAVIKALLSIIITVFMSSYAFQIGAVFAPITGGLLWMSMTLFTYFALMAYSYAVPSGKGRWGTLTTSSILGFVTSLTLMLSGITPLWGTLIGSALNVIIFIIFYRVLNGTRHDAELMPRAAMSKTINSKLERGLDADGWEIRGIDFKKQRGDVTKTDETLPDALLAWGGSNRAYLLYPVRLSRAFSSIGNRRPVLAHERKNINPWLLSLVFRMGLAWKSRGADITLVLLDMDNKNGETARVIGVSLPDTKKKIPVPVVPASRVKHDPKNVSAMMRTIEDVMEGAAAPLSAKQAKALSRIGVTDDGDADEVKSETVKSNDNDER